MTNYVLGFLFDQSGENVLLIQKQRPAWQKDRWNGIGGKVDAGELPLQAMVREMQEETGLSVTSWKHFCTFMGNDKPYHAEAGSEFAVHCFKCYSPNLEKAETKTDEAVQIHEVRSFGYDWLPNLRWLISMALSAHMEHRHGGWFQIIERCEDQSPAKYEDTFKAWPEILDVQEILNPKGGATRA